MFLLCFWYRDKIINFIIIDLGLTTMLIISSAINDNFVFFLSQSFHSYTFASSLSPFWLGTPWRSWTEMLTLGITLVLFLIYSMFAIGFSFWKIQVTGLERFLSIPGLFYIEWIFYLLFLHLLRSSYNFSLFILKRSELDEFILHIKPCVHSMDKPHIVRMYYTLYVPLDSGCSGIRSVCHLLSSYFPVKLWHRGYASAIKVSWRAFFLCSLNNCE